MAYNHLAVSFSSLSTDKPPDSWSRQKGGIKTNTKTHNKSF